MGGGESHRLFLGCGGGGSSMPDLQILDLQSLASLCFSETKVFNMNLLSDNT